jgi:hypothetical protein
MADDTKPAPKVAAVQPRADDKAAADDREARKAAAKGGQVILDPESDASYAARGVFPGEITGNEAARNAHLASHGLDPLDPDPVDLPGNVVPAAAGSAKPDAKA